MTLVGEESELQTLAPSGRTERPCAAWQAKATGTGLGFPRLRPSPGARADWGCLCRDGERTNAVSRLRPGRPPWAARLCQKVPGGSWPPCGLQARGARAATETGCRKAVPAAVPRRCLQSQCQVAPPACPSPREGGTGPAALVGPGHQAGLGSNPVSPLMVLQRRRRV